MELGVAFYIPRSRMSLDGTKVSAEQVRSKRNNNNNKILQPSNFNLSLRADIFEILITEDEKLAFRSK